MKDCPSAVGGLVFPGKPSELPRTVHVEICRDGQPKEQEVSRCKCGELLRFSLVTGLWSCGACMTEITVAHVNQEGQ